ncbi:hypothetical protein D3C84_1255240 [compost metagenome]
MPLALGDVVDRLGGDGGLDFQQDFTNRDLQFLGQGGGHHLASHLYQQIVLEVGAQAPQHAAGG